MKRKRYSEEKIISILNQHEAGASVPDSSRRRDKFPVSGFKRTRIVNRQRRDGPQGACTKQHQ